MDEVVDYFTITKISIIKSMFKCVWVKSSISSLLVESNIGVPKVSLLSVPKSNKFSKIFSSYSLEKTKGVFDWSNQCNSGKVIDANKINEMGGEHISHHLVARQASVVSVMVVGVMM